MNLPAVIAQEHRRSTPPVVDGESSHRKGDATTMSDVTS